MKTYFARLTARAAPRFAGDAAGPPAPAAPGGQSTPPGVTTTSAAAQPAAPTPPAPSVQPNLNPGAPYGAPVQSPGQTNPGSGQPGAAGTPFQLRQWLATQVPGARPEQWADDQTAAQALLQTVQQAAKLRQQAEYGARYVQHAAEFERWQAEQAAAKAKLQQDQGRPAAWWQPPEFDEAWLQGVQPDPQTGQLVAKPGYPPDLPSRIERFREFQREKLNQFTRDPMATIKPGLEQVIGDIVGKAIQQNLGAYQQQQTASAFVQQNMDWLAQKDAQGRFVRDASGAHVLTPAGQRFRQHAAALEQAGVVNVDVQQRLAQQLTQADLLSAMYAQNGGTLPPPGAAAPGQPQPGNGLQRLPNQPAGLPAQAAPPASGGRSLRDMILQAFDTNGITDEQLRNI